METKNQESKIQRGPDETNLKAQCLSTVAGLSTGSRSYLFQVNVSPSMEKKMIEEVEEVLMRYSFIANHDYKKPYRGEE